MHIADGILPNLWCGAGQAAAWGGVYLLGRHPEPREIVASGNALAESPAWAQMIADALGRPVLREKPSAMNPPPCSWRGSTVRILF